MIDIHCHILPGLDDGAYDLDEALLMARQAVGCGIHTVIATPHYMNGKYYNRSEQIVQCVKTFQDLLDEHHVPLRVLAGQEIRVYPQLVQDVECGFLSPLGQSRYMLIELPPDRVPSNLEHIVRELRLLHKVPIIAHPECNREITESPEKLLKLVAQGALSQLNAHSLLGDFGKSIMQLSLKMCRNGLAHFISSNAHNTTSRSFALDKAYGVIQDKLGQSAAQTFQHNARCVVHDLEIDTGKPSWETPTWFQIWKAKFIVVK